MHPTIRENGLPLNLLPTLFLTALLSDVSTVILQRNADKHLKQNRARLAAHHPGAAPGPASATAFPSA